MSTRTELPIEYARRFSVQLYWDSHGVLLLQSRKTAEHSTRLHILFTDVRWMALPMWFDGIRIEQGTMMDLPIPLPPAINSEAHRMCVFKVTSSGIVHALVAGKDVQVSADSRDDLDSPLLPDFKLNGFGFY